MEESQGETQLCSVRSPREPPHFRGKDMGTVSSFCRVGGGAYGEQKREMKKRSPSAGESHLRGLPVSPWGSSTVGPGTTVHTPTPPLLSGCPEGRKG